MFEFFRRRPCAVGIALWALSPGLGVASQLPTAADCGPIDLRETTMKDVPVMDQDGLPICYSFATSAMIDAWRFKNGDPNTGHHTSPIALAVEQACTEKSVDLAAWDGAEDFLEKAKADRIAPDMKTLIAYAGKNRKKLTVNAALDHATDNVCTLVERASVTQSCDNRALSDRYGSVELTSDVREAKFGRDSGGALKTYMDSLAAVFDGYHAYTRMIAPAELARIEARELQKAAKATCQMISVQMGYNSTPAMNVIIAALKQENPMVFLKDMLLAGCTAPHRVPVKVASCTPGDYDADAVVASLKNGLPAEIGFCADVLSKGPKYRGLGGKGADECPGGDNHSALVIGRRPNPKDPQSCQLLVHNSWGADCDQYRWCIDPEAVGGLNSKGLPVKKAKKRKCKTEAKWDCEKGNIWVDADALGANANRTTVIR